MQFDFEFSNKIFKFALLELEIFLDLNLSLKSFLINISEPSILFFDSLGVQSHELNFVLIYRFELSYINLELLC